MSAMYRLLIVLLATTSQVACFPYKYTLRPPVVGRVVSAQDDRPIANAVVADPELSSVRAVSNADGTFLLPARKKWGIWLIIPQEQMILIPFTVSAYGYKTATVSVRVRHPVIKLNGPIRLQFVGQ